MLVAYYLKEVSKPIRILIGQTLCQRSTLVLLKCQQVEVPMIPKSR